MEPPLDLDFTPRRPDASRLGPKQLADELEARGARATGFTADDVTALQALLDAEYAAEMATLEAARAARDAARAQEAAALEESR
jgi:hypothetical protein